MNFRAIFNSFSNRGKPVEPFIYTIPTTLRNKVLMFCFDKFGNNPSHWGSNDFNCDFWGEMHHALCYRHGRKPLVKSSASQSPGEDTTSFLSNCQDEEFLDFVEYIFKVKCLFHISSNENSLVSELNELFASENSGYELTHMVKKEVEENTGQFGKRTCIHTVAYPQIIKKQNRATHSSIILPTLQLLSNPKYTTANKEYLEALDDFKKKDYGDCLTKCCSAFESTMKIVCESKGWPYNQTDTASKLISTVLDNSSIDSFFKEPLTIIATLRNRLSKAHGAGTTPKMVSQNIAHMH